MITVHLYTKGELWEPVLFVKSIIIPEFQRLPEAIHCGTRTFFLSPHSDHTGERIYLEGFMFIHSIY
jgi:hypothetical protein